MAKSAQGHACQGSQGTVRFPWEQFWWGREVRSLPAYDRAQLKGWAVAIVYAALVSLTPVLPALGEYLRWIAVLEITFWVFWTIPERRVIHRWAIAKETAKASLIPPKEAVS